MENAGGVHGVVTNHGNLVAQVNSLVTAVGYHCREPSVCLLQPFNAGLLHGVFAALYVGFHSFFAPPQSMSCKPAAWLLLTTKTFATTLLLTRSDARQALTLTAGDKKSLRLEHVSRVLVKMRQPDHDLFAAFAAALAPCGLLSNVIIPFIVTAEGQ